MGGAVTRITNTASAQAYLESIREWPPAGLQLDGETVHTPNPCYRCGGTGWFRCQRWPDGGRCFKCLGAHTLDRKRVDTLVHFARRRKASLLARAKADAKREAQHQAHLAKQRDITGTGETFDERHARLAREREAARAAERAASAWVGKVGDRIELEVTVLFTAEGRGGQWGPSTVVKCKDDSGNLLVWFASGSWHIEPGSRCKVRGTVKAHDEYRGGKQTVMTRCKLVEIEQEVTL